MSHLLDTPLLLLDWYKLVDSSCWFCVRVGQLYVGPADVDAPPEVDIARNVATTFRVGAGSDKATFRSCGVADSHHSRSVRVSEDVGL